jgi:DNA-binding NarL/FixJ family response regulator
MGAPHTSRVYIVSQTSLFAQGIRSLLGGEPSIEILGVENDPIKAIESARSLQPEVIIVEDPAEQGQWERLGPFIRLATGARIVALNLNLEDVTVYDHHHIAARGPADLVEAIQGTSRHADRNVDSTKRGLSGSTRRTCEATAPPIPRSE